MTERTQHNGCAADGMYLRRPLVGDEPLAKTLHIRVTRAEYEQFGRVALKRQMPVTDLLREILKGALIRAL